MRLFDLGPPQLSIPEKLNSNSFFQSNGQFGSANSSQCKLGDELQKQATSQLKHDVSFKADDKVGK